MLRQVSDMRFVSLRERKKSDSRQRIIHVANTLFRKHGFDAVSLDQIAEKSVISKRTIVRYFATKEALALAPEHDLLDSFGRQLHTHDTDAVTRWRTFYTDAVATMDTPEARRRLQSIFDHNALLAEFLRVSDTYQDLLAAAIDEETRHADPLGSKLFAALLVSGARTPVRQWLANDEPFDHDTIHNIIDRVIEAFDHRDNTAVMPPKDRICNSSPTRVARDAKSAPHTPGMS
jgi:AcrR family transcriptional regulator